MNKKHIILSLIIGLVVGGLLGALGYSKTVVRYDAITTACVIVNQAVENELLTPEQVKQVGSLTGANLKKEYPSLASKFALPEKMLKDASESSNCSQFIVGVNEAK